MKKTLISEITKMRKIMGLNEAPSPAPARPDVAPDVDTPTKPGTSPKPKHPFNPKPSVIPNPKNQIGLEEESMPEFMNADNLFSTENSEEINEEESESCGCTEKKTEDESINEDMQAINELPMSFNSPERPAPDVERALADKTTTFSRNPGIPLTGEEPGQSGEELIASQHFQQVVEKVKRLTGRTDLRGQDQSLMMLVMQTFMDVSRFESQHRQELEQLAETLVKAELGEVADSIRFELTLVGMGQVEANPHQEEEITNNPEDMTEEQIEDEQHAMDLLDDFSDESAKRRIINAIIQGAAMKGHHLIEKPEATEMINQIAGQYGNDLVNKYGMMMAVTEYQYWTIPGLEDKIGGGQGVNGSEEVEYDENEEKWVVKAKGIMLPILIHEALKGAMEVIGQHGIPDDPKMAQAVINKEDVLFKEIWDMRLGPIIWQNFRTSLPFEILEDNEEAKRMLLYVIMEYFRLPVRQFLAATKKMLSGDNRDILEIVQQVKDQFAENAVEDSVDVEALSRIIDNEFEKKIKDPEFSVTEIPGFKEILDKLGIPTMDADKNNNGEEMPFHPSLNEEINKIKKLLR